MPDELPFGDLDPGSDFLQGHRLEEFSFTGKIAAFPSTCSLLVHGPEIPLHLGGYRDLSAVILYRCIRQRGKETNAVALGCRLQGSAQCARAHEQGSAIYDAACIWPLLVKKAFTLKITIELVGYLNPEILDELPNVIHCFTFLVTVSFTL